MVHWHCDKVSRAGSDFPEPGHEDHRWGENKGKKWHFGIWQSSKCFCSLDESIHLQRRRDLLLIFWWIHSGAAKVARQAREHCSNYWRKKKCSFLWLFISTYNVAPTHLFRLRTIIICVTGDTMSGPTPAHGRVKVMILVEPGYLISPDGLSQWLPNVHS